MNIAYIRVSTDKQDKASQKLEIQQYCKENNIKLDKILEVEISTRKTEKKRKIPELKKLKKDDLLITCELSRLGRSMFEVIELINEFNKKGVKLLFLRQRELSNFNEGGAISKLLVAIYSYFTESEREFISLRTKSGLQKARANGKILGRPKGLRLSSFDKDEQIIKELLAQGFSIKAIYEKLYNKSKKTYASLAWFCRNRKLKNQQKDKKCVAQDLS